MIFGACPYCDHPITISVPDVPLPVFEKIECDNCHKEFFEYMSRIEPRAYKPEELEIDEENHSIKIRGEDG